MSIVIRDSCNVCVLFGTKTLLALQKKLENVSVSFTPQKNLGNFCIISSFNHLGLMFALLEL